MSLGGWPAGHWGRGQGPVCFKQLQLVSVGPGYHTSVLLEAPIPDCNRRDRLRQGATFLLCLRRRDKTALQGTDCARQALNGFPFMWFGLGPRLLKTSCPCLRSLPSQADLIAILAALPPSVTLFYGEFSLLKSE